MTTPEPTATTPPTARPFNLWPWLPVFVIGAAAIANGAIILAAKRVSPQKVEEQAYAASAHFDADKAAAEAFTARGHRLDVAAQNPKALRLSITGKLNGAGEVRLYRPDAPAADAAIAWNDLTQPLMIPLTRPGLWRLDVRLTDSDGTALAAKDVIDTLAGQSP